MPRVAFRRTKPRLWRGNGFGYEPAHYAVDVDGVEIGTLLPRAAYGWRARIRGLFVNADNLADAKAAIRSHLAANRPPGERPPDHVYEPGAYGVCRRCGGERHPSASQLPVGPADTPTE